MAYFVFDTGLYLVLACTPHFGGPLYPRGWTRPYVCRLATLRQWLRLLRPFTYVKNLYVSKEFVPSIVPALQELIGYRTTEVLPILQNIFFEGLQPPDPVQEGIGHFVAARQLIRRPVTVSFGDRVPKQDRYPELFTV